MGSLSTSVLLFTASDCDDQLDDETNFSESEEEKGEKPCGNSQPARKIQASESNGGTYEGATGRANDCLGTAAK